jgi:sodium-independent sulfate anion transporter 11
LPLTRLPARFFFFVGVLRNAFVLLIMTITAWLYCHTRKDANGNYPIEILKDIPPGLKHVGLPQVNGKISSALAPQLPVAIIILCLEHIAISKST